MKKRTKILSFLLALVMSFAICLPLTACSDTPNPDSSTERNKDPYVKSVEILSYPNKTEYYEGEIFQPAGLKFNATWVIEGKEKVIKLTYGTCQGWTHKNEPLTPDVDKITFTIYGCSFDVPVSVKGWSGVELSLNVSSIRAEYTTEDTIDLSGIEVYTVKDGTYTAVPAADYELYDGTTPIPVADRYSYQATEGEHTLKVVYFNKEKTFSFSVVDKNNVISPYHVQAEDCTYTYGSSGEETDTLWARKESYSWYCKYQQGNSGPYDRIAKIKHGAEGYAISNVENLTTYFIKFNVYVPKDGNYDLLVRAQASGVTNMKEALKINVNGETNGDGTLKYDAFTEDAKVLRGNQRYDAGGNLDSPGWFNMYYWTTVKLGTFALKKGDNVIRLQPTGQATVPNIDYFEWQKEGTSVEKEMEVVDERSGSGVVLGADNAVYIKKGEKLGDITGIAAEYPEHYTLIYLRISNYKDKLGNTAFLMEVPVLEEMITGIDYEKTGEQTATIHYTAPDGTSVSKTFRVVITE